MTRSTRASTDVDILIAGAGCAGLSCAVHLLWRGPRDRHVTVLDPRTSHGDDRTWCGFRGSEHPFRSCVTHSFSRIRVAGDGRVVLRDTGDRPYEHIPSRAFYRHALGRIDRSARADLRLGVAVQAIEPRRDHVRVTTDEGELRARLVLDSRPATLPPRAPGEVRLLQSFVGWFVRTERPVFDPSTATLMDFEVPQVPAVHFLYVLPLAQNLALVEDTHFARDVPSDGAFLPHLERFVDRLGGSATVERRERGVIPMSSRAPEPPADPRVQRVGLRGGFAKPSTGYAFEFIQRRAAYLAESLRAHEVPPPRPPRRPRAQALDAIFLAVLDRRPDEAPRLFADLFERVPTPSLIRFLSESQTLADDLRVMGALPSRKFIEQALLSRKAWVRAGLV